MFKLDDVYEAIEHCNFRKAIGPDMFDSSVLKDTVIKSNVAAIITVVLNSNKIPEYFREYRLSLFCKTKSTEVSVEDTRPIAIESHILKIVENAIKLKVEKLKASLFVTGDY